MSEPRAVGASGLTIREIPIPAAVGSAGWDDFAAANRIHYGGWRRGEPARAMFEERKARMN